MRPISAIILPAVFLPLALVAACSEPAEKAPPPPAVVPAAMLGGVDLNAPMRALGTEPFWGVDFTADSLVYSGVDRPEQRASKPEPVIQGTTAVYTAATQGGTVLVVTLIATECSDGMSDRTYPLTARVEIGPETLNGCAASTAFLTTAPQP